MKIFVFDLLAYGAAAIDEPGLVVPHPRMADRAFVLVPLATIAPGLVVGGRAIEAVLAGLDTGSITERPDLPPLR